MELDMQEAEKGYEHQLEVIDDIPNERKFWVKNQLLDMGYELTTQEYRLLKTIFSMIKRNDRDLKTYRIKAAKFKEIFKEDEDSIYRTVDKVLSNLKKRLIKVYTMRVDKPTEIEKVEYKNWLSTATYWVNQGVIDVSLDKWLKDFFISMKLGRGTDGFTIFLSNESEGLNHYSERLYDLLKKEIFKNVDLQTREVNPIIFAYDDLRRKLDLPLLKELSQIQNEKEMNLFDSDEEGQHDREEKKRKAQQLLEKYLDDQLKVLEAKAVIMGKKKPKEVTDIPDQLAAEIFALDPDLRVITNGRGKNKGLGKVLKKRPPTYKLFGDFNVRILKQFYKDITDEVTAPYVHFRLASIPEGIKTGKAVTHIRFHITLTDRYMPERSKDDGKSSKNEFSSEEEKIFKELVANEVDIKTAQKAVKDYDINYIKKTIVYCKKRADKNLGGYIVDCLINGYGFRSVEQEEKKLTEVLAKREIEEAALEAAAANQNKVIDEIQSMVDSMDDLELMTWKKVFMEDKDTSEFEKKQVISRKPRESVILKLYIRDKLADQK